MAIIIFGASGDLARRKLFPSLSNIKTKIVGYARSKITNFQDKLAEFHTYSDEFLKNIEYINGEYNDLEPLEKYFKEDNVYYFSVPPSVYVSLLLEIKKRFIKGVIAIEKPFASDLVNYNEIVDILEKSNFKICLIDHYLLKPIAVSMKYLVKPNFKHVESVFFIVKERVGIEGRTYFDDTGIIRDIIQNHLLELYALLLGDDRVDVLKKTNLKEDAIFGQYVGYANELGKKSNTETFGLVQLKNKRIDANFVLLAGKGMDEKLTEIRVKYKEEFYKSTIEGFAKTGIDYAHLHDIESVELVYNIAPKNEVFLEIKLNDEKRIFVIHSKEEINGFKNNEFELEDHALVFDALARNEDFPVTSIEEGKIEWEMFETVKDKKLFYYEKGTNMPKEAKEMINNLPN